VGFAGLCGGCSVHQGCDPKHVDRGGSDDVLQMRVRKASIAGMTQPAAPDCLCVGTFNAGSQTVGFAEVLNSLLASHRLESFVMFSSLQADDSRLQL